MKIEVKVSCELPPDVTDEEFLAYVEDAVQANIGMLHPSEPLFNLDRTTVKASLLKGQQRT